MPKRKKTSGKEESKEDGSSPVNLPRALLPGMPNQLTLGGSFPQQLQAQIHPLHPPNNDFLMSSLASPMMGADFRRQFFSASSLNPLYNLPPPSSLYPSLNEQLLAMQLRQRIASHDAMIANSSGLAGVFPQPAIAPNLGAPSFNPPERLPMSSGVASRRKSDPLESVAKRATANADASASESGDSSSDDEEGLETKDEEDIDPDESRKRAATEPFPEKLHKLLKQVEAQGKADVISFSQDGRAFMIHKPDEFFADIVPKYFKQSRLSSFKRQLNLYGFEMITSGPLKGAYFHEHFSRDRPDLCRKLRRRDVKFISRPKNPQGFDATAPDFYSMPPIKTSEEAAALAEARDKKAPAKSKAEEKRKEKGSKRSKR